MPRYYLNQQHAQVFGVLEVSKQFIRAGVVVTQMILDVVLATKERKQIKKNGIQPMHIHLYVIILCLLCLYSGILLRLFNIFITHIYDKQSFVHLVLCSLFCHFLFIWDIWAYLQQRCSWENIQNFSTIKLELI